jgi:hypothetical protein
VIRLGRGSPLLVLTGLLLVVASTPVLGSASGAYHAQDQGAAAWYRSGDDEVYVGASTLLTKFGGDSGAPQGYFGASLWVQEDGELACSDYFITDARDGAAGPVLTMSANRARLVWDSACGLVDIAWKAETVEASLAKGFCRDDAWSTTSNAERRASATATGMIGARVFDGVGNIGMMQYLGRPCPSQ